MKIKISAYKPKLSTKTQTLVPGVIPYEVDFFEEMLNIKNGKYKNLVDTVRAIENKKERDALKIETLPALTISALVKNYRSTENIIAHSGLLNIDIDAKGNDRLKTKEDFEQLRLTISSLPIVVCAFLSVSGQGLTFVVKINPDQHEDCFRSIEKELKENISVTIDKGTGDTLRLRFVSYDPDMYLINPDDFEALTIYKPTDKYIKEKKRKTPSQTPPESQIESDVEFVVRQIELHKIDITSQYEDWRNIGFALADGIGERGRAYFHRISEQYELYDQADCDLQYDRCLNGKRGGMERAITYKTFFQIAKDHALDIAPNKKVAGLPGTDLEIIVSADLYEYALQKVKAGMYMNENDYKFVANKFGRVDVEAVKIELEYVFQKEKALFGFDKLPAIEKVEHYFNRKYDFRRNIITQKAEYRAKSQQEFDRVNADSLYRDACKNGLNYALDKIKSLLRSDFVKDYDPFREYFESLPSWDGHDHITDLANHVQTTDQEFWVSQFKKAIVRHIPCSFGNMENRMVMVLVGEKQNTGKSTFIKYLNPFGNKYYTDEKLKDDKDSIIRLSENFIYNLEELAGARGFEINQLKAIISKKAVKQRKAYAEDENEQPRRCSFWASTNTTQFLTDTENTRWLCFEVISINHSYNNYQTGVKNIDVHQVWAQAFTLYKMGFNYQLTMEEENMRDQINAKYETTTSDYEFIMQAIGHPDKYPNITPVSITASSIAEHVQTSLSASGIRIDLKNVPRALKQLGFRETRIKREDGTTPRVYRVVKIYQGTVDYKTEQDAPF